MKIKIAKKVRSGEGILIAPVFEETLNTFPVLYSKDIQDFIKTRQKKDEFKGKFGITFATYFDRRGFPEKLVTIGLGKVEKFNARKAREIGGKIGKHIKCMKPKELSIMLLAEMMEYTQELVEGLLLALYTFDEYKSKKEKPYELKELHLVAQNDKGLDRAVEKAELIVEAVNYCRALVDAPANKVNQEYLASEARRIAKENKYKIAVFGNKELSKMGWGGLLAVNQGSANEARAMVLEYDGGAKKEAPIVIVGKGIVFDTGGYNLKPTNYIETMHLDMGGAAAVLGIFSALKKLGIKKNVIGIICAAENMINENAYRPSDIIKMLSGKTVEVRNTDAEGRLVLADGISYGINFKPEKLITIATLTGAVAVALGNRYAGLMGNNVAFRNAVQKAGREVDELGWPLPIHRDIRKDMDSDVADYRNIGKNREAGSSQGAAFLEKFVEKTPWCHIDIGGTAFTERPKEFESKGATGYGVRMLLRFLENESS